MRSWCGSTYPVLVLARLKHEFLCTKHVYAYFWHVFACVQHVVGLIVQSVHSVELLGTARGGTFGSNARDGVGRAGYKVALFGSFFAAA